MKVAVVAEYFPNAHDPAQGIWAHRQALAARRAGADPRVVVLRRPIPPLSTLGRSGSLREWLRAERAQGREADLDGIDVTYVRYLAPPRPLSYADWGEWAARRCARALSLLHQREPFDLVHAHYAIPAARAARGFAQAAGLPLVTSVHGGDLLYTARRFQRGRLKVAEALRSSRLVLANSTGTADGVVALGVEADRVRVVHLGADPPVGEVPKRLAPTLCTLGYLVPRKRHGDVLSAMAIVRNAGHLPDLRYVVVGDGPERSRLEAQAGTLGLADAVEFTGQLPPAEALRVLASTHLMVMPSADEAFGVAYVEAMACGVPAVGVAGEAGPEEIAALGGGMVRVPPADSASLADAIVRALDPAEHERLSAAARVTATDHFSWQACGEATVRAYEEAL